MKQERLKTVYRNLLTFPSLPSRTTTVPLPFRNLLAQIIILNYLDENNTATIIWFTQSIKLYNIISCILCTDHNTPRLSTRVWIFPSDKDSTLNDSYTVQYICSNSPHCSIFCIDITHYLRQIILENSYTNAKSVLHLMQIFRHKYVLFDTKMYVILGLVCTLFLYVCKSAALYQSKSK